MLDDSKIRSLILSISVTLCMAARHVYFSRGKMPAFFKCTLGNTYMLHMATDQGRILEQAGDDIENCTAAILTYI